MDATASRQAPALPPIVEGQILAPEDYVDVDEQVQSPTIHQESSETTPLIRSGHTFSYSDSIGGMEERLDKDFERDGDAEGEEEELDDEDDDNVSIIRDRFSSSIMTDFQASLFLPSLQVSLHSTLRGQSADFGIRSRSVTQVQKAAYQTTSAYQTASAFHSKSVLVSLVEKLSDDRGASYLLTVWNILPCLLGSAIFAMPYVVAKGGYLILIPLVVICLLADATGVLLIDCLYEISPRSKNTKRVRLDVVDVADAVWGKHGARLINFLLVFYLTAADIVNLVLLGNSAYAIVHPYTTLSHKVITSIFAVATIPTLFIGKLSTLAYLSMLSVLSIIAGGLAVIVTFGRHYEHWEANATTVPLWSPQGSLLAISMVLYTVIAHPVLSQIEGSMRQPAKFRSAIHLSYWSSTFLKCLVGILGCLTFGLYTKSLVSLNVSEVSFAAGIASSVALMGYAIFSFPLNLFVVCELLDAVTVAKRYPSLARGGKYGFLWLLFSRPIVVGACLGIALVVPYFGLLVGIIGSFVGTAFVFVFPCVFHVILKRKKMSKVRMAAEILVTIFGVACGLVGLYASVRGLVEAFSSGQEG